MANDQPTSLRMGFGYGQARASGMGGIRADRSPDQVNREISERKVAKQIREEVELDPEWGPFVEHWIRERLEAQDILQALWNAKFDVWRRRKGFKARYAPF